MTISSQQPPVSKKLPGLSSVEVEVDGLGLGMMGANNQKDVEGLWCMGISKGILRTIGVLRAIGTCGLRASPKLHVFLSGVVSSRVCVRVLKVWKVPYLGWPWKRALGLPVRNPVNLGANSGQYEESSGVSIGMMGG